MAIGDESHDRPPILDIRRSNFEDSIPKQVTDGLSNSPKTLPALLFYSTEGLKHWDHHSHQPDYYLRIQELQILRKHAYDMALQIAEHSIIVDLGSASLDKVIFLLEALESQKKNVVYYALDLSAEQLESTLLEIPTHKFKYCKFAALHGTFDDGLHWLKKSPKIRDLPHCILFLGLTIGNYSRDNAAAFLRNVAEHSLKPPGTQSGGSHSQSCILLSIDSCKKPTQVLRAYTADGVVPFALAALDYANSLFAKEGSEISDDSGVEIFNVDEWDFLSEWNYVLGRHEASLIPKSKDIKLGKPLDGITVAKTEKIRFGCSYKYDQVERDELFAKSGLKITTTWSDVGCDLAFYKLELS